MRDLAKSGPTGDPNCSVFIPVDAMDAEVNRPDIGVPVIPAHLWGFSGHRPTVEIGRPGEQRERKPDTVASQGASAVRLPVRRSCGRRRPWNSCSLSSHTGWRRRPTLCISPVTARYEPGYSSHQNRARDVHQRSPGGEQDNPAVVLRPRTTHGITTGVLPPFGDLSRTFDRRVMRKLSDRRHPLMPASQSVSAAEHTRTRRQPAVCQREPAP